MTPYFHNRVKNLAGSLENPQRIGRTVSGRTSYKEFICMKAKELITKVLVVNPKTIVSVFTVMLLISGIQGVSYGAAPEFPSTETGERSIEENTAVGVSIGLPVRATDSDNDRLTYTLSGTDLGIQVVLRLRTLAD